MEHALHRRTRACPRRAVITHSDPHRSARHSGSSERGCVHGVGWTCIGGIHDFLAAPEFVALVFQDPAGAVRRGGAPGLANVAPDHPIWVRFARAMGPFMALDAKLVAEHAGDPPPRRVLDISASHG